MSGAQSPPRDNITVTRDITPRTNSLHRLGTNHSGTEKDGGEEGVCRTDLRPQKTSVECEVFGAISCPAVRQGRRVGVGPVLGSSGMEELYNSVLVVNTLALHSLQ